MGRKVVPAPSNETIYYRRRAAARAAQIHAVETLVTKGESMSVRDRRLTRLFTRTFAAALLLGACAVSALTPAAAQTPTVLRMARNAEPGPYVPWLVDDNTALFTLAHVYAGLVRVTKDGANVEPALATSWDISADGLTWTFHLRPGVMFSDGTPLTSNDVKVSLDIARTGQRSTWKDNYKAIKEIQAPDPMTVNIVLSTPHAPLLSELAMFPAWIMQADKAKSTEATGYDDANNWASKGTGGYYTESWKKGDPVVL